MLRSAPFLLLSNSDTALCLVAKAKVQTAYAVGLLPVVDSTTTQMHLLDLLSAAAGARIVLKSRYEHEVERINVYQDRFLVANTAETLMLGDMDTCRLSEISWENTGAEKYHFDNPQVFLTAFCPCFALCPPRFSPT